MTSPGYRSWYKGDGGDDDVMLYSDSTVGDDNNDSLCDLRRWMPRPWGRLGGVDGVGGCVLTTSVSIK